MKKKISAFIVGIIAVVSMTGFASATGPTSATSTSWGAGSTISSQWLNAVGTLLNSLYNTQTSTSTPLGTIANQATTTGNILVASTTSGWVALAVGSNGQCPIASSSAPLGIAWGICGGSINGTLASSYFLTASGVGFSVSTNGATTTFSIASSSYLQPLNNLSELTNTSTARSNLGLGTAAQQNTGTFLQVANNLSDLNTTSTARTNLGVQVTSSIPYATSTGQLQPLVIGTGLSLSNGTLQGTSNSAAGTSTNVQYNTGGAFDATSTFTFTSSTQTLVVPTATISSALTSPSGIFSSILGVPHLIATSSANLVSSSSYQTIQTISLPSAVTSSFYNIAFNEAVSGGAKVNSSTVTINGTTIFSCTQTSNPDVPLQFNMTIWMQGSTSSQLIGFPNLEIGGGGIQTGSCNNSPTYVAPSQFLTITMTSTPQLVIKQNANGAETVNVTTTVRYSQ